MKLFKNHTDLEDYCGICGGICLEIVQKWIIILTTNGGSKTMNRYKIMIKANNIPTETIIEERSVIDAQNLAYQMYGRENVMGMPIEIIY